MKPWMIKVIRDNSAELLKEIQWTDKFKHSASIIFTDKDISDIDGEKEQLAQISKLLDILVTIHETGYVYFMHLMRQEQFTEAYEIIKKGLQLNDEEEWQAYIAENP